jgi:hypothetical protein
VFTLDARLLFIYLGQLVVIKKIWSVTVDEGAEGETILEAAQVKGFRLQLPVEGRATSE